MTLTTSAPPASSTPSTPSTSPTPSPDDAERPATGGPATSSGFASDQQPSTDDPHGHAWLLAQALVAERGEPSQWRRAPVRTSLASAVIDAIMSARVTTSSVDATVRRYEARFGGGGAATLAASFDGIDAEGWRAAIGTNHRTHSSVAAPYKADVIELAALLLLDEGVDDVDALWARAEDPALREAWCGLPGQTSGASWRHLLLVSGYTEPLVCPLTRRFVRRTLGRAAADSAELPQLVTATADILDVAVADVDHQIWRAANAPARRHDERGGAQDAEVSEPAERLSATG